MSDLEALLHQSISEMGRIRLRSTLRVPADCLVTQRYLPTFGLAGSPEPSCYRYGNTGVRSRRIFGEPQHYLPRIAARIGLEIRNEYLLGYRPTNQSWDGKYRHITLKVVEPGFPRLRAYWRRGYYTPVAVTRFHEIN